MKVMTLYECQVCNSLYYDMESALECESMCILEELQNNNIVYISSSRREAYELLIEYEDEFDMSYEEFCIELDKGYTKSDYTQVARLYEDSHGRIWCDSDYEI